MHPERVLIPSRFNGPPDSANGGITCGLVAGSLSDPVVEVTLLRPPPLDVDLRLDHGLLYDGGHLVAEAGVGELTVTPPPAVSVVEARAAGPAFVGLHGHPFPTCFVCGTERTDGLGLTPGPVADDVVAVDWTPESADLVLVWAALDCPGGWSVDLPGQADGAGPDDLPDRHAAHGW